MSPRHRNGSDTMDGLLHCVSYHTWTCVRPEFGIMAARTNLFIVYDSFGTILLIIHDSFSMYELSKSWLCHNLKPSSFTISGNWILFDNLTLPEARVSHWCEIGSACEVRKLIHTKQEAWVWTEPFGDVGEYGMIAAQHQIVSPKWQVPVQKTESFFRFFTSEIHCLY